MLSQAYQPVEYILVDGGSTDGSLEIIQEYSSRLAWWVSEPDAGQAEAINKGLAHARGEIVAWLNSDDIYLPGALDQAATALQASPGAAFIFGDAVTVNSEGAALKQLKFPEWRLRDLVAFRIICQPAVFIRRSVLDRAGPLDTSYHFLLDHQLWIRLASLAPIDHLSMPLAAARHHPAAKNVAQPAAFSQETLRLLEWMETQPDLAAIISQERSRVNAGAYRLSARYLLDGGQPRAALHDYRRALQADPGYTLHHWHRMLFAVLSLAGLSGLSDWYRRIISPLRGGSAKPASQQPESPRRSR